MSNSRAPLNKIIYVDPKRCIGCHGCEVACAVSHSTATGVVDALGMSGLFSRTHVVAVDGASVPMQCRQCEDAPCTKVCPTGAMRQAAGSGSVSIDDQTCIGCKLCTMVCPFGVVTVVNRPAIGGRSNGGVATKCDLCIDWRERNDKKVAACQEACMTRAISLVDLKVYREAMVRARAAEIAQAHRGIRFSL